MALCGLPFPAGHHCVCLSQSQIKCCVFVLTFARWILWPSLIFFPLLRMDDCRSNGFSKVCQQIGSAKELLAGPCSPPEPNRSVLIQSDAFYSNKYLFRWYCAVFRHLGLSHGTCPWAVHSFGGGRAHGEPHEWVRENNHDLHYLGRVVGQGQVQPVEAKVQAVKFAIQTLCGCQSCGCRLYVDAGWWPKQGPACLLWGFFSKVYCMPEELFCYWKGNICTHPVFKAFWCSCRWEWHLCDLCILVVYTDHNPLAFLKS